MYTRQVEKGAEGLDLTEVDDTAATRAAGGAKGDKGRGCLG